MKDKEKQIEEMARTMCPTAEHITCDKCVAKRCTPQMYAGILYGAGYRKADKETPKTVTHEATLPDCLTCPTCKRIVSTEERWGESNIVKIHSYCPYCGQRLQMEDNDG